MTRGANADTGGEVIEARLRRLDTATLADFVADCWRARGFETRREDGVVVATDGVESVVVAPVGRRRVGSPPLPDRPVDVVVAPGGGERVRTYAAERGARVLDATALRGMLRHAMDRTDADAIAAAHLGAPLAELRPPRSVRARERMGGAGRRVAAEPGLTLAVVLLALVAVATVTVFGTPADPARDLLGSDRPTVAGSTVASPDAAGLATPEGTSAGRSTTVGPGVLDVPGLGTGGVVDAEALAAAHERQLANGSYALWLDVYAPRNLTPGEPTVQRDIDVLTDGRTVRVAVESGVEEEARDPVGEAYFDGSEWFAVARSGGNATYHRADASTGLPIPVVDPDQFRTVAVERFVAAPETRVSGPMVRDGVRVFRVDGTGAPAAFDRPGVEDYAVTAYVTPEGLVRSAEATYTVRDPDGRYDVTLEWTIGNRGETAVLEPAWLASGFGNASTTATE